MAESDDDGPFLWRYFHEALRLRDEVADLKARLVHVCVEWWKEAEGSQLHVRWMRESSDLANSLENALNRERERNSELREHILSLSEAEAFMKRGKLVIDQDLWDVTIEYVDKQLRIMGRMGQPLQMTKDEYDELVYKCAEYPQRLRNQIQKSEKRR